MVGWHHRPNGHEFEHTPGDGEGQGSLACCSLWGLKESDTTEQLNDNKADRLREYHAKTNKSEIERQTLYVITHCCSVTKSSPTL